MSNFYKINTFHQLTLALIFDQNIGWDCFRMEWLTEIRIYYLKVEDDIVTIPQSTDPS